MTHRGSALSSLSLALLLGVATPALGDSPELVSFDLWPEADRLQILILHYEVIAIDAHTHAGVRRERIGAGERVLWADSRGTVGLVVTNRRVLAATSGSTAWSQIRLGVHESPPLGAVLGHSVALVFTSRRAIGLVGNRGRLFSADFGANEVVIDGRVSEDLAVVVTDRRALGLSAASSGFSSLRLKAGEPVEAVAMRSGFATMFTPRRVLIFRAPTAAWEARSLRRW
ncbi:MAG: hypothetical protein ACE5E4_06095 [Candidatus Binatia bacterium]